MSYSLIGIDIKTLPVSEQNAAENILKIYDEISKNIPSTNRQTAYIVGYHNFGLLIHYLQWFHIQMKKKNLESAYGCITNLWGCTFVKEDYASCMLLMDEIGKYICSEEPEKKTLQNIKTNELIRNLDEDNKIRFRETEHFINQMFDECENDEEVYAMLSSLQDMVLKHIAYAQVNSLPLEKSLDFRIALGLELMRRKDRVSQKKQNDL